jgi:acetyl-CoA carboxylase carboxyl transferase subunit alpha
VRHTLDFEKTISDLQDKIAKLKDSGSDKTSLVEVNEQIEEIKVRIDKKLDEIYKKLTPWHKLQVSRHPNRPHFLDYVKTLFEDFEPLSGDRLFKEDPALLCGFATFHDKSLMIMGHEKGKDTEERIKHNFGMAKPEGYRKAMRLMKLAEKFNLPIITFIDTPGAYPGVGAEQRGQSEAIAKCIEVSLNLKTPTISIIIGEGGSGGAIAIATTNKVLMLEHSIYSVISPEGCASILWKNTKYAEEAASSMKITAQDLKELNVIDSIISEPLGGAHRNPNQTIKNVGDVIWDSLKQIISLNKNELLNQRKTKYLMTLNKSE